MDHIGDAVIDGIGLRRSAFAADNGQLIASDECILFDHDIIAQVDQNQVLAVGKCLFADAGDIFAQDNLFKAKSAKASALISVSACGRTCCAAAWVLMALPVCLLAFSASGRTNFTSASCPQVNSTETEMALPPIFAS